MPQIYLVGGAVRDILLGIEPKDRDYVIVGAATDDVEYMLEQGFTRVGADFPVFLHPTTGEEYALARVERKVSAGYNGFESYTSPELTIEDDLARRDLTINAMAMAIVEKACDVSVAIIDPFDGQKDLKEGMLRHVSPAFAEDPLRVLRVARFAARYGFNVHPDTMEMMTQLVNSGELDHLTPERVFVELEKLFSEKDFAWGISILEQCGAMDRLFGPDVHEEASFFREMLDHVVTYRQNGQKVSDIVPFIFTFAGKDKAKVDAAMKMTSLHKRALDTFTRFNKWLLLVNNRSDPRDVNDLIRSVGLRQQQAHTEHVLEASRWCSARLVNNDEWYHILKGSLLHILSIDFEKLLEFVPKSEMAQAVYELQADAIYDYLVSIR